RRSSDLSILSALPNRASCMSPARTTASTAVVRKRADSAGDNVSRAPAGPWVSSRLDALGHADFHPAFRRALQLDVVHEVADQEDAAAARLEEVLGRQRIGDRLRLEAFALIADANHQLRAGRGRRRLEIDEDVLARVVAVAVLDGVDDRLADRNADPVRRILVEADAARDVIAHNLHEVEHLERTGEFEPDDLVTVSRHATLLIS